MGTPHPLISPPLNSAQSSSQYCSFSRFPLESRRGDCPLSLISSPFYGPFLPPFLRFERRLAQKDVPGDREEEGARGQRNRRHGERRNKEIIEIEQQQGQAPIEEKEADTR